MNIQNLNRGHFSNFGSNLRDRLGNAYQQLAAGDDYKKNSRDLRAVNIAVVTISAAATGFTNAFAHRKKLGDLGAFILAALVVVFVEKFYFTLRHGLTTCYQSGKQRFYALLCYRTIQLTMILNGCIFTAWIFDFSIPSWLEWWNHYSLAVHFSLGLLGVQAVRDSDAVVENQMLELKAATARQDIVTLRKAAAIGSPLALLAAKVRGLFDATALSFRLLFSGGGFSKKYVEQINQVAAEQYGYLDAVTPAAGQSLQPVPRRPGFVNQGAPPKSPARWI